MLGDVFSNRVSSAWTLQVGNSMPLTIVKTGRGHVRVPEAVPEVQYLRLFAAWAHAE